MRGAVGRPHEACGGRGGYFGARVPRKGVMLRSEPDDGRLVTDPVFHTLDKPRTVNPLPARPAVRHLTLELSIVVSIIGTYPESHIRIIGIVMF